MIGKVTKLQTMIPGEEMRTIEKRIRAAKKNQLQGRMLSIELKSLGAESSEREKSSMPTNLPESWKDLKQMRGLVEVTKSPHPKT